MPPDPARTSRSLLRDVAVLQLKLALDALRDLVLSPLTLGAVLLDLMLARSQSPRYFHAMLRLGERSDSWIDLWSAARPATGRAPENVDALIARVEDVVRDPAGGARRARVLARWAERQMRRARRSLGNDSGPPQPPPPQPPPS